MQIKMKIIERYAKKLNLCPLRKEKFISYFDKRTLPFITLYNKYTIVELLYKNKEGKNLRVFGLSARNRCDRYVPNVGIAIAMKRAYQNLFSKHWRDYLR